MAALGMKKRKPFNKSTGRDYKAEYTRYQGTTKQKQNRAKRNAARAELIDQGRVAKGDGREVDHKKAIRNGGANSSGNLRVLDRSRNRGFKRTAQNRPIGGA
jgi:hypothetical protein